jgi:lipoate-protein ligase B
MTRPLPVIDLGRRAYAGVLDLQRELCRRRVAGETAEDVLLLVEHEPVITLGRGTRAASLPIPSDELERRGVAVVEVERGRRPTTVGTAGGLPDPDLGATGGI